MSKLCGYIRVSSESQKDNTSLESQRERIQAYCSAHGHELLAIFWDIKSASGRVKRHGFYQAMRMVTSGNADGLVAIRLDRIARSVQEGLLIAHRLDARGRQLVLLDCNLDTTTPVGKCIFSVLLAFAQLERETIVSRCGEGVEKKKERNDYGVMGAGRPPFGFKAVNKQLVPDPEKIEWRKRIFQMTDMGYAPRFISKMLNDNGVKTPSGGKTWNHKVIWNVLRSKELCMWWERGNDEHQSGTG